MKLHGIWSCYGSTITPTRINCNISVYLTGINGPFELRNFWNTCSAVRKHRMIISSFIALSLNSTTILKTEAK